MYGQMIDQTMQLDSGEIVRFRPLMPDDAPFLVEIFERMSFQSRYRRFNQTLDQPDLERVWSEAEQIAHAVALNSRGIIAFTDTPERRDIPVGASRFVRTAADEAELAVSVRDDYQSQGIGRQLVQLLIDEARREGIHRLTGLIQNDNDSVWAMLKRIPVALHRTTEGGFSQVFLDLDSPPR